MEIISRQWNTAVIETKHCFKINFDEDAFQRRTPWWISRTIKTTAGIQVPEPIIGHQLAYFKLVHPDDEAGIHTALMQFPASKQI
ncbi:hypothetical protein FS800_04115 [Agrobacterium vitis]|uniref:hypothetical protein n=1 Tax=Allorhizobium ampelinum TaxID=3025782 RepID=UPI001F216C6F|nr:hypothetical protein [Allorhizobium ampelinum]MCF1481341.1 hypothetical protein [Allorhizobium ampelinum]